ncbi:hypothetical protein FT643_21985 [Ketobacter sp. MCCC 1A13808]|nr:hypothetical protein [Ketobacter sp. MCCC 1A13808]
MSERAQQQMAVLFPNFPAALLWHRKQNDGYASIPKTLPIVMQAIDAQSKGKPAGHTLFCLWARSPDHPLVTVENPATFASEAGFSGERAVDTWRRRMKKLKELNFIATREGASGDFHYVLLLNPNIALESMWESGFVQDVLYARFQERLLDIGAYADIERFREFCNTQTKPPSSTANGAKT